MFQNNLCGNLWNLALILLMISNYNLNFILSNIKTLPLVRYITNYSTKQDYSQYQRMIDAVFIQNAYNKVMQ